MTLLLFACFFFGMIIGMPVAFALLFGGIVAVVCMSDLPIFTLVRIIAPVFVDVTVLVCIPLFILAGNIMALGGIGGRIVEFANIFVGRARGGLGTVNVISSLFFGGISGSAAADTAAIGSVMIPAMVKEGYPLPFATAITIVSSPLGMIIPPSIIMIVYCWTTGQSVATMFAAGYIPGLILGLSMMVTGYVISVRNKFPVSRSFTFKEALHVTRENFPAIVMPLIILGSIVTGLATPTEAAAIAVAYGFLVARYFYKDLTWELMPKILSDTAKLTGSVLLLLATASVFAWVITFDRTPFKVAEAFMALGTSKEVFLPMYIGLLFIMGMFMAPTEALIIVVPVLFPLAGSLGIHPLHFGIISCTTLALGQMTPPVGFCLYLGAAISGCPVEKIIKALLPFYFATAAACLLIAFIPALTLLVPQLLGFL